jgi:hypothetical protein
MNDKATPTPMNDKEIVMENVALVPEPIPLRCLSCVIDAEPIPVRDQRPDLTLDEALRLFEEVTQDSGVLKAYNCFNNRVLRQSFRISDDTWHTMAPRIKEVIDTSRTRATKEKQARSEDNEANKKCRIGTMLTAKTHTQDNGPSKKNYAISDSGADSCCLGKHCHPVSYTGRYAILEGYNPERTRSGQIPIVTAYIKAMSQLGIPIVIQINEAPYMNDSQTTLISEYQVREHGITIDSVAKHHKTAHGTLGNQRMTLSEDVYLPFVDRGGIMGFEILPWEEGDENIYAIFEITGNTPWKPRQF